MQQPEEVREIAWVIADTETTGLTGPACEVALHEINPDTLEMLWEIDSLIDPQTPIEPGAMAVHGITDEMVAHEPTMDEFIEHRLGSHFHGRDIVLICHNASFDFKRLNMIGDVTSSICTLFHSRQLIGAEVANHKLQTLREHFGFPVNEAHRALADVYTTKRLLRELMGRAGRRTLHDFHATQETTVHRMPWGKHKGELLMAMPVPYLTWLKKECADLEPNLKKSVEKALKALK